MDIDEISYIIHNFPFPPSTLPKPLTHEKCIDNPIHDPSLFDKTVSEYFSKLESENNDNEMIKMEINVTPNGKGKILEKSSLSKELSFNESIDSTINSHRSLSISSRGESMVTFPLEKIKLIHSTNEIQLILKDNKHNSVNSVDKHSSKSNPSIYENKGIIRNSLQKIKFGKSKSMNNIKNQNNENNFTKEPIRHEHSLFKELSTDFKKFFASHKEESKSVPASKHNSCVGGNIEIIQVEENNKTTNNKDKPEMKPLKYKRFSLHNLYSSSTEQNKLLKSRHSMIHIGNKESNKDSNINKMDNKIKPINKEKEQQNNSDDNIQSQNENEQILLIKNENVANENENNNSNKNNEDNNTNTNTNNNELVSDAKDEISIYKTDIVDDKQQKTNNESETSINDNKNESDNGVSNSSLSEIEECKSVKKIEATRNSLIKNKSVSITLLAPFASISLEEKKDKQRTNKKEDSLSLEEIENKKKNKQPVNEYSKEYIRQISCQRIDRYRMNGSLVRDRIQRFRSNEELMKSPIKLSSNSIQSNSNGDDSNKSLKSVSNDNDNSSSLAYKLKFYNSQSEYPLYDSFKSNDDIIKEKITVLNMSARMNSSYNSFSQLQDEKKVRENDLLENLELLRQGIIGTIPINKKDKLKEFLIGLTDENLDNYQKQIHDEYSKQQELNNIENKTILLNKYCVNFGYSKNKIPIEEEVNDTITIESKDKNHFIVVRIRSQNSCFGVNIKNCNMEADSIFKSNEYSIPKILKIYRELLISNNAYQNGSDIFEDRQNKNEVIRIKKQVINNEPVISLDVYSIAYLFKNWFYELPRKLLYQINQQTLLEDTNFSEYNDKITGLERV
ncbi:hypothetical protein PIROE2DRAFT_60025 [Piromyces sp. E2]|nr:hypothetical protein PIROE2DRAFT_60025 [Piromyces sp. E2]|eukprot:OUM65447.1 hypothetical protein PIROE2DRAFT_60025 [Piromyces sp. E2]